MGSLTAFTPRVRARLTYALMVAFDEMFADWEAAMAARRSGYSDEEATRPAKAPPRECLHGRLPELCPVCAC